MNLSRELETCFAQVAKADENPGLFTNLGSFHIPSIPKVFTTHRLAQKEKMQ